MNNLNKALKFTAGSLLFFAIYWFLLRNQIVGEFLRPQVESGKLGSATANIAVGIIEVLAAIGGVVLAMMTKLLDYLASVLEQLVVTLSGGFESTVQVDSDPKKLTDDLSKLLVQAVMEANPSLTVELAHRLARKEFLTFHTDGSRT